jgi:very-short-patch-repair endonuclease
VLLAIEYDGRQHAENSHQWGRDISRREDLEGQGWRLIIVRSDDILRTPGTTVERIVEAMRAKGMSILAGVPTAEMTRHFAGR